MSLSLRAPVAVALWYFGAGFVVWLAWSAAVFEPLGVDPADDPWRRRTARALAVLGVLHPAAALAAHDLGPSRLTRPLVVVSVLLAVAVVVLTYL